ncbi:MULTISPECIES: precorrin-6A synthase (deacetylating) [unclassified Amycolatopsis]|uniref:precorrin-6A synthase (deacetylating) n=1 Tax=unclassified Amycolatopsis TaxID=2618356 RepID=UPI00287703E0|nr:MULTISPECIES: precorrin-6A synthase (deacetylating) [unclassified Amycolatopsis]MDS0136173.1 precorrin-6A synthase (deacetylating) [Amycolatopsis sp. 505]MDS0145688.1 precorrin-6A synthase (deacetylating) [Amycolatopsis sp. CM201R]
MRKIYAIGIGAGDPEHLTVQAIDRLNRVDVFFVLDKGAEKSDLVRLRQEILDRFVTRPGYRVVLAEDPPRDRTPADYRAAVADWHAARAAVYENLIRSELGPAESGAFLVWGDPSLYDSTIALIEAVLARGNVEFEYEVVPGISSISALVARHRTTMNQIGRAVQLTTGRRLATGWPEGVDDVFVLLDAHTTFDRFASEGLHIFWGAYIGTPDEILLSGPLTPALAAHIREVRAEARERRGWIMDTYLLRRPARE